jgi:hypothetical protein
VHADIDNDVIGRKGFRQAVFVFLDYVKPDGPIGASLPKYQMGVKSFADNGGQLSARWFKADQSPEALPDPGQDRPYDWPGRWRRLEIAQGHQDLPDLSKGRISAREGFRASSPDRTKSGSCRAAAPFFSLSELTTFLLLSQPTRQKSGCRFLEWEKTTNETGQSKLGLGVFADGKTDRGGYKLAKSEL